MEPPALPRNALLDLQTGALMAHGVHPSIFVLLNEWSGDTVHLPSVHYPNDMQSTFLNSLKPEEYTNWTWDAKERKFVATRPDVLTNDMKERSRLLVAKYDILSKILFNLSIARYPVRTGVEFQETVYLTKKFQAQRFKDNGYDESGLLEYPYVVQYADFAGISMRQAADDIILKASIDDQILAKTELLRLKYFNKVRKANNPDELPGIFEEFIRDCFVNAHV